MVDGFFWGALIGGGAMLFVCLLLLMRPAPAIDMTFGGKRMSFTTRVTVADAYRAIANPGPGHKFSVARQSEGIRRVLLADGLSLSSWGFYYPVDLVAQPDGTTEVSLGIRSKALQWGPLVTRAQKKMLDQVQALVEGPRA
jgi:hypothetical protein